MAQNPVNPTTQDEKMVTEQMDIEDNPEMKLESLLSDDEIYKRCTDTPSKQNYMQRTFECFEILLPHVTQTRSIKRCYPAFYAFLSRLPSQQGDLYDPKIKQCCLELVNLLEQREKELEKSPLTQPGNILLFGHNSQASPSSSEPSFPPEPGSTTNHENSVNTISKPFN